MIRITRLCLWTWILIGAGSCKSTKESSLTTNSHTTWELRNIIDNYNKASIILPNPAPILQLKSDHTFTFSDATPPTIGKWKTSPKPPTLYLISQNETHAYTFEIPTKDSLILSQQGRHGLIKSKFVKIAVASNPAQKETKNK